MNYADVALNFLILAAGFTLGQVLFGSHHHKRRRPRARLGFTIGGITLTGTDLEIHMNIEQQLIATVLPVTALGNPAAIDGVVQFTSDREDLVAITQQSQTSALIAGIPTAGGTLPPEGVAVNVQAIFDADLGEGVTTITLAGILVITSAQAVGGSIVFGDPSNQGAGNALPKHPLAGTPQTSGYPNPGPSI